MSCKNIFSVDCSSISCPSGALGAADVMTQDCSSDIKRSEVNSIILFHPTLGTDPTSNWPTPAAVDFSIDNADATDADQKQFFGRGSLGEPEAVTTVINDFREFTLTKEYTLTFTIFDIGGDTYDYMRKLECGAVVPLLLFTTVGGEMYGNSGGICPKSIQPSLILDEGNDAIKRWQLVIKWEAQTAPDAVTNPL